MKYQIGDIVHPRVSFNEKEQARIIDIIDGRYCLERNINSDESYLSAFPWSDHELELVYPAASFTAWEDILVS